MSSWTRSERPRRRSFRAEPRADLRPAGSLPGARRAGPAPYRQSVAKLLRVRAGRWPLRCCDKHLSSWGSALSLAASLVLRVAINGGGALDLGISTYRRCCDAGLQPSCRWRNSGPRGEIAAVVIVFSMSPSLHYEHLGHGHNPPPPGREKRGYRKWNCDQL